MIEVQYKARLGNNLFQYCLGRILAEELGFELRAGEIAGFPGTRERVEGQAYELPRQVLTGNRVDLRSIVSDRSPRRIVLDGWFQRIEYYQPYREEMRRWLELEAEARGQFHQVDLVTHVRRTDYVANGWALPFSYYEEAIERALPTGGQLWVATDDPKDPFFERFSRWRPRFLALPPLQLFHVMTQARRLILSQSTFGWWPAFLGDAEIVVAPAPSNGSWSGVGDPDGVNLIDEARFLCLRCGEADPPTNREREHQAARNFKRDWILRLNRRLGLSLRVPPP